MLELNFQNEMIKNPVSLTQMISISEGSEMRLFEIIKSDGRNYLRTMTEKQEEKVSLLEEDPCAFTESFLALEGKPESAGIGFKCSLNTAYVLFAMADLKKRIRLESLLTGKMETEFFSAPESALEAVEDVAFDKTEDFRMPLGFFAQYMGKTVKPDLKKAFAELREKGFILKENGAVSIGGAAILTALSHIHAALSVDQIKEDANGEKAVTRAVYLNCYHSLWMILPPTETQDMVIGTIGLEDLRKDLKTFFD